MQDIQTMFGDGGVVDRRMRPPHNNPSDKCPRCDSLNTKFCYYNNYNLSQPRHFCKGCKRYWTKGGVLRNVPVGGGCRKNKRSKPNPSSDSNLKTKSKSNSRSSSDSSSLTAAAATTIAATLPESSLASPATLISFQNPKLFLSQPVNSICDPLPVDCSLDCGIFPDIGSFTNLMTSSNDSSLLGFNRADILPYNLNHENQKLNQQCDENQGLDPTVEMDLSNVGLSTVDWQAEEGLFDLTGNVDQSFWSHANWSDDDHNDKSHNQHP